MKSIVGLANDYDVVGKEDTADVDGVVQVDAQAGTVQLIAKVIDENTEQQGREITFCMILFVIWVLCIFVITLFDTSG